MSDGMGRELAYLSSHATNRFFIPNWGKYCTNSLLWCSAPYPCRLKRVKQYQNESVISKIVTTWNAENRPGISADGWRWA